MRTRFLGLAALLAASSLPSAAQETPGRWSVGVQVQRPSLGGRLQGVQDGQPVDVDLDRDLALGLDKATPGFFLDFEGPRFGFQLAAGQQDYLGDRVLDRAVTVDGRTFAAATRVRSDARVRTLQGLWTVRFVRKPSAWLGFDLGAEVVTLDLDLRAAGVPEASTRFTGPLPQVGLSGGGHVLDDRVVMKGYLRYMAYGGATFTLTGADVRYFPVKWFGLRAFYETEHLDLPKGSVKEDLGAKLDRSGGGFGAVFRF